MTEKITNTRHIRKKLEAINKEQSGVKKSKNTTMAQQKYQGLRLNWRDIVILVWLLFFVGLYHVQAYAQKTIKLDDVNTGMMLSYDQSTDDYSPLKLVDSEYNVNISGIIAEVTIKQTFRNNSDEWIDQGMYAFPVANNAAVYDMQMRLGKRLIVAEIHEKKKAQQIYNQAKADGMTASLVKQYRPNLFTTDVANIMPKEHIEVRISYQQTLLYDAGHIDFRLPLAIKSRYMQGAFLAEPMPQGDLQETHLPVSSVTDELKRKIHINLEAGFELSELKSMHHDVEIVNSDVNKIITLADDRLYDQHDFVLRWYPHKKQRPQAAMFSEKINGEEYVLMMLLPPQQNPEKSIKQNREVIFIIDTSGSMHGQAINAAKDALLFGLTQMTEQDKFNIIEFNSYTQALFKKSVSATANHLEQAIDFIDGLSADGGTIMAPALSLAMQQPTSENLLKQIVFITDGSVGNEAQLFKQISQDIDEARLFTVAIGAAPNNYFMDKAAVLGRGSYTNIADLEFVDESMNELFVKITSPTLTNIMVEWGDNVEQNPKIIPDLYKDEPVIVTAKMQDFNFDPILSGFMNDKAWSSSFQFKRDGGSVGVAKLWARQYIEQLNDDLMLGADVDADRLQKNITDVALAFHLVSPFTSLVAVDKTPQMTEMLAAQVQSIEPAKVITQAAYPQTSLGWKLQMLIGVVLMFLASLVRPWQR